MRLPPTAAGVSRGVAAGRRFAADARLASGAADSLAIVLEEWLMNVVEHGRADARSQMVIALERRGDRVRLSLSDAGVPFDPRAADFDGPNTARGGGAGLALIRAWSRIETYRRAGGRNRLVLELAA